MSEKTIIIAIMILFIALSACKEESIPSVFNPDEPGALSPVITSIDPADFGLVSITEIKIIGTINISFVIFWKVILAGRLK